MKGRIFTILFLACAFVVFGQNDTIYGLNFTTGQLRFASMDISTGTVNVMNTNAISSDGFSSGVADFDPITKTYYYTQGSQNMRLFSVDATTGNVLGSPSVSNPNNAVAPITNIAYNWLNDSIYGLQHGNDLRLVSADPNTGALNVISNQSISSAVYLSGNSDIDPIHRRYFYSTGSRIYTVDIDDGTTINNASIVWPYPASQTQFLVNMTYNWYNDTIYCLHFLSVPNTNPWGDPFTSELRLATVNPANGVITLLSQNKVSNDGYQSGVCDIDPVKNRYMYVRQDSLYIVDLSSGNLITRTKINNPNSAVSPITNIAYDDLKSPPPSAITMDMGADTITINQGDSVMLNAFVGDNVNYTWQDGSTNHSLMAHTSGTYQVNVQRSGFNIQGAVVVKVEPTTNTIEPKQIEVKIFPNPAMDFVNIEVPNSAEETVYQLYNIEGKLLSTFQSIQEETSRIPLNQLPNGIYILKIKGADFEMSKKIVVRR